MHSRSVRADARVFRADFPSIKPLLACQTEKKEMPNWLGGSAGRLQREPAEQSLQTSLRMPPPLCPIVLQLFRVVANTSNALELHLRPEAGENAELQPDVQTTFVISARLMAHPIAAELHVLVLACSDFSVPMWSSLLPCVMDPPMRCTFMLQDTDTENQGKALHNGSDVLAGGRGCL